MSLKVGIIGYGLSGQIFHGKLLMNMKEFDITKIYTRNPVHILDADKNHPNAEIVDDVDKIFEDSTLDIVVICTPNETHFDFVSKALNSGKHVVIEKPFTITTHDALRLIDLERDTNKSIAVYHNRRFDGDYLTIKNIIKTEAVGRVVELESHFDRFRSDVNNKAWREHPTDGSGILYDLGPHLIDQALDLFGLPNEVYADISKQRRGQVDDNFEIILYYSELKVILKASMLVNIEVPRFIVHGSKGSYVKYGLDSQEQQLKDGLSPDSVEYGVNDHGTLITDHKVSIQNERGNYMLFYKNLYRHLVHNEPLLITSKAGFDTMRIIEAAIHSNELHKRIPIKH